MRIGLSIVLGVVSAAILWAGAGAWQWSHADTGTIFRQRIVSELPPGETAVFAAGSDGIVVGEPQPGARFVCGSVAVSRAGGAPMSETYSLYLTRGLFGWAINDGYTPATRPENQAVSDEQCAQLRTHAATLKQAG